MEFIQDFWESFPKTGTHELRSDFLTEWSGPAFQHFSHKTIHVLQCLVTHIHSFYF